MKKAIWIMLIPFMLFAQDKNRFDLEIPDSGTSLVSKITGGNTQSISLNNDKTGITLLSDGFFTVGTTNGLSEGALDDKCQITFGHPYAMTSYPFFNIDGVSHNPELLFYGKDRELRKSGDTLFLSVSSPGLIKMDFSMVNRSENNSVLIQLNLTNLDASAHQFAAGLVFDPAIGLWGDGNLFVNDTPLLNDTLLQSNIPDNLEFWERETSPRGIGVQLTPTPSLSSVRLSNWYNLYEKSSPEIKLIYDTAVELLWGAVELQAGVSITSTIEIKLPEPDFPDGLFMRSAIPSFLSDDNNLIFPQYVTPLTLLYNSGNAMADLKLKIEENNYFENWESSELLNINNNQSVYTKFPLTFPEVYNAAVVPFYLSAVNSSGTLDRIRRNIYLPAVEMSDTGLIVDIDTVITSEYPKTDVVFSTIVEETGQFLNMLKTRNIGLKENNVNINDFSIARDTTGGVNQADIVFVLDVTGSMTEEIAGVKNNIIEFSDSLSSRGIDVRLAMVTFLDVVENKYGFTSDVNLFKSWVGEQYAHGGDDRAENSLEAIMSALQFEYRPAANKTFIWITDADYHIEDNITPLTVKEVVNSVLAHSITINCIGDQFFQTDYYNPLILPTGGNFYDIKGNFRDILLDISNLSGNRKFRLTYNSSIPLASINDISLDVHYAGLGGTDSYTLNPPPSPVPADISDSKVECYPNPFNPVVNIVVSNPAKSHGDIQIYNILGEKIRHYNFSPGQQFIKYAWHADNNNGMPVSNGIYFVHTRIYSGDGAAKYLPVQKIVYTK